ncbi:MAG: hypothetical protein ABI180_02440 [Microcoleus sp.]
MTLINPVSPHKSWFEQRGIREEIGLKYSRAPILSSSKSRNQVQRIKSRCFCAADLTLHSHNQLLLAIGPYLRTWASGELREDVNRRIGN